MLPPVLSALSPPRLRRCSSLTCLPACLHLPLLQVPYLVPLPSKHTLSVKRPDLLAASAFGDLREDNLQLVIQVGSQSPPPHLLLASAGLHTLCPCARWLQAKKIIKTQTTMRVEAVEVKAVEEREPWTLPSSIFKPRVKEADARNFFDTPLVRRRQGQGGPQGAAPQTQVPASGCCCGVGARGMRGSPGSPPPSP